MCHVYKAIGWYKAAADVDEPHEGPLSYPLPSPSVMPRRLDCVDSKSSEIHFVHVPLQREVYMMHMFKRPNCQLENLEVSGFKYETPAS